MKQSHETAVGKMYSYRSLLLVCGPRRGANPTRGNGSNISKSNMMLLCCQIVGDLRGSVGTAKERNNWRRIIFRVCMSQNPNRMLVDVSGVEIHDDCNVPHTGHLKNRVTSVKQHKNSTVYVTKFKVCKFILLRHYVSPCRPCLAVCHNPWI